MPPSDVVNQPSFCRGMHLTIRLLSCVRSPAILRLLSFGCSSWPVNPRILLSERLREFVAETFGVPSHPPGSRSEPERSLVQRLEEIFSTGCNQNSNGSIELCPDTGDSNLTAEHFDELSESLLLRVRQRKKKFNLTLKSAFPRGRERPSHHPQSPKAVPRRVQLNHLRYAPCIRLHSRHDTPGVYAADQPSVRDASCRVLRDVRQRFGLRRGSDTTCGWPG